MASNAYLLHVGTSFTQRGSKTIYWYILCTAQWTSDITPWSSRTLFFIISTRFLTNSAQQMQTKCGKNAYWIINIENSEFYSTCGCLFFAPLSNSGLYRFKVLNSFLIFNVFSEFADPPFFSGLRQRCNIRAFASRGPCNGEPSRIYSRTIDFEGSILGCTNGGIPISRVIQLILLISHSSAGSVDSCAPFFEIRTHFRGWISLRLSVQEVGKSVGLYCSRDEFLLVADAISREVNVFVTFVVCRSLRKRMSRSAP